MPSDVTLHLGDCLEVMGGLPDGTIDLVLCDLPYGTTACRWDEVIPFEPLWAHYRRLLKPRGAVVLTASQPFTSMLVMSNPRWYRHSWVWAKGTVSNFQLAKVAPLKEHEDILVFAPRAANYQPRMTAKSKAIDKRGWESSGNHDRGSLMRIRSGDGAPSRKILTHDYPRSILHFNAVAAECNGAHRVHPTQKPVALMEYLVRTYTEDGAAVLDNTFGSCTTGVACINTNRKFIGIEKDEKYFEIGRERVEKAIAARSSCGTTGSSKPDSRGDSLLPLFQIPGTDACDVRG